ncbi:MAG: hypothetical protein WD378_08600, partial [Egicoccus sp.]
MRHTKRMVAVLAAATLALTACGDDGGDEGDTPEETETTEEEGGEETEGEEGEETEGEEGEEAADLSGAEVSVFGAPTSIEGDAINGVIEEYFNQPTGANAFYEGSDSFEQQVQIRVDGGNPP